ncbi:MAG TPA: cyanophycin synthetase [Patescibacteria group bacterium]|nr:cyanophycin synthetase [Patescibacteria group bacterium]
MNSFAQIKQFLDKFVLPYDSTSSYSLERVEKLLGLLGNPQEEFKTIHVAGTSGKTSTAYYISGILKTADYKVGLSVSPHVLEVNERIQVGLVPLPEKEFCIQFNGFIKILNELSIKPTYFELFVIFAYWYFAKISVDYAVVEVGLGGMFDATNVIKRPDKICVITDIGLDHTHILGSELSQITEQKAGIIKKGNQVFMNQQADEIMQIIRLRADAKGATLHLAESTAYEISTDLPLFQQRNWVLARNVCEYVFEKDGHGRLSHGQWRKTVDTIIPGRLEIIEYKGKKIILDGAHNSQKMEAFVSSYKKLFPDTETAVLLAITETKDLHLAEMADQLSTISDHILISSFTGHQDIPNKSIDPQAIAKHFSKKAIEVQPDLKKAFQKLLDSKEKTLLVTGSLYLISAVKKLI